MDDSLFGSDDCLEYSFEGSVRIDEFHELRRFAESEFLQFVGDHVFPIHGNLFIIIRQDLVPIPYRQSFFIFLVISCSRFKDIPSGFHSVEVSDEMSVYLVR